MVKASDYLVAGDDGHGLMNQSGTAENPGKRTPKFSDGYYILENQFNRAACNYFLAACKRCGFRTLALAPEDTNTPISTRTARAKAAKVNASVSWHFDAITGTWQTKASGQTVFYQKGRNDSLKLANCVHKYIIQGTQERDRGVKANDLAMCRDIHTGPAILIENGFMDCLLEAQLMLDPQFQQEQAEQACMGICEYFGVPYAAPAAIAATDSTPVTAGISITIESLPVGFNEFITGRRIIHQSAANYESMDEDGFRYYVGGICRKQFLGTGAVINPGIPDSIHGEKVIISLPVGYDEYLPKHGRRISHLNAGTYRDMSPEGMRWYVNGSLVNEVINPVSIIDPGVPASTADRIITAQPVGYDEYLPKLGRRILHLNAGTYVSLDPDAARIFVNGKFMCQF